MKLTSLCVLLGCAAVVLAQNATKGNDLLRVCYYTGYNPIPKPLNTSLCTHILVGFATVENLTVNFGNENLRKTFRDVIKLKSQALDLKVMLSVGGGGGDKGFSQAVNTTLSRTKFIVTTLIALGKYGFDGLDIDWEFPVWNTQNRPDKQNFALFLKEFKYWAKRYSILTEKPEALLSVAVAAPKNIVNVAYNITEMAKYVDFINLMSYDFHDFFWYTPFTDHNSPLFNRSVEKSYFATLNTAWAANYWFEKGMPKSKIMVGVPTYAHTYILQNPDINGLNAPALGTKGDLNYPDVCKLLMSGGTRVFDTESQVPYAFKGTDWVSYEDTVSILGKAKWIKSEGYGGAMTFSLNCDDWSGVCGGILFPLQSIIYSVFTAPDT